MGALTSRLPEMSGKTKAILAVSGILIVVIGYFILQALVPRSWGRHVASEINESITRGILYGLGYGLLGSAVTLILLYFAYVTIGRYRNILSWSLLVLALASTVPNLMTLGVVIGNGSGAVAGRQALDGHAVGFRGATLVGLIVGIIIGLAVDFYLLGRRRAKAKAEAGS
ncbi:hypothetical protein nbrc107696_11520 [Gordonia spumicola]|uniref:Permease n=2 Tax=Gordonia spumicola TaxID=589161 RepID=A0A7I9V5P0_9ACTN|nr:hypothetical protein nbrc107696_11520 [Gordonia spumicola]